MSTIHFGTYMGSSYPTKACITLEKLILFNINFAHRPNHISTCYFIFSVPILNFINVGDMVIFTEICELN